jgi:hypothetical protein
MYVYICNTCILYLIHRQLLYMFALYTYTGIKLLGVNMRNWRNYPAFISAILEFAQFYDLGLSYLLTDDKQVADKSGASGIVSFLMLFKDQVFNFWFAFSWYVLYHVLSLLYIYT